MTKLAIFTLLYWKPIVKGTAITVLSALCIWIGTSAFKQNNKINRGDKAYDMSIKNTASIDSVGNINKDQFNEYLRHCAIQEVEVKYIKDGIDRIETAIKEKK